MQGLSCLARVDLAWANGPRPKPLLANLYSRWLYDLITINVIARLAYINRSNSPMGFGRSPRGSANPPRLEPLAPATGRRVSRLAPRASRLAPRASRLCRSRLAAGAAGPIGLGCAGARGVARQLRRGGGEGDESTKRSFWGIGGEGRVASKLGTLKQVECFSAGVLA